LVKLSYAYDIKCCNDVGMVCFYLIVVYIYSCRTSHWLSY